MPNSSIYSRKTVKSTATILCDSSENLLGETIIDEKLLSKAVSELNAIYVSKGMETAKTIGSYVINTFFEGDINNFRKKNKKHVTFRALARRNDLAFAFNTIWYSVAVLEQFSHLPKNLADSLSLAHHKLLLPIEDIDTKIRLAQKAVNEKLSTRKFGEMIREERIGFSCKPYAKISRFRVCSSKISRIRKEIDLFVSSDNLCGAIDESTKNGREALIEEIIDLERSLLNLKKRVMNARM